MERSGRATSDDSDGPLGTGGSSSKGANAVHVTASPDGERGALAEGDALEALILKPEPARKKKEEPPMHVDEDAVPPFRNEPLRDFSRAETRTVFAAALRSVSEDLGIHCPAVIAGEPVETAELVLHCLEDLFHLRRISQMATRRKAFSPQGSDLGHDLLGIFSPR